MEDGFMLWQDPVTGLFEQKKIEPEARKLEVLEEPEASEPKMSEEVGVTKPKATKPVEKKK